jgi:hypothetical protein
MVQIANPKVPGAGGSPVPTLPLKILRGKAPKASYLKLNGLSWPLKTDFSWGYHSGTDPQIQLIPMLREYAEKFTSELNEDITLTMGAKDLYSEDIIEQEYQKLWLILRPPGDYNHDVVILTDDRWAWGKKLVTKAYNLARKSTDRLAFSRTTAGGTETLVEAVRYFSPPTIIQEQNGKPARPYKALDIVLDVLTRVLGYDAERINVERAAGSFYVPMNQDLVGVPADVAIRRFLDLSDNDLYLENDGNIVIYANRRPITQPVLDGLFPNGFPGLKQGNLFVVDRTASRPTEIDASFEREIELLCSYTESATPPSRQTAAGAAAGVQARADILAQHTVVENVTVTVVNNQLPGLPRGSIVPIQDAITGFGVRFGTQTITFAEFVSKYGGFSREALLTLLLAGKDDAAGARALLDHEALTAFGQIMRDFRSLFRLRPALLDRIRDLKPVLVDIVNPETGTRQKSEVFSIVSWFLNYQPRRTNGKERIRGEVLDSFTDPATGAARDKYIPIDAELSVDAGEGLVRVNFLPNLNEPGVVNNILRGRALNDQAYRDAFGNNETVTDAGQVIGVQPDWKCAFVLSAIHREPNDGKRLAWIRSKRPEDIPEGRGPRVEIHVGDDTARFALNPANALVNKYISPNRTLPADGWVNKSICRALAQQECVRRWYLHADQAQGGVAVCWAQDSLKVRPVGTIGDVRHTIGKGGRSMVSLAATNLNEPQDVRNLLPEDVLRVVYRQLSRTEPPQGGARP